MIEHSAVPMSLTKPVETKVWAKALAVHHFSVGSYTEGKFYEALPENHDGRSAFLRNPPDIGFDIIDDDGDPIWCAWGDDDPDVTWERHEFPVGINPNLPAAVNIQTLLQEAITLFDGIARDDDGDAMLDSAGMDVIEEFTTRARAYL